MNCKNQAEKSLALWKPALALVLLCAISVVVWKYRTARPSLLVGWLWFLGTLVPVIGIVHCQQLRSATARRISRQRELRLFPYGCNFRGIATHRELCQYSAMPAAGSNPDWKSLYRAAVC